MQALAISNLLPAKAPGPGAESLLSQSPQQSSPFAALIQANLKAHNDVAKLPVAGKVKDSTRPQDVSSTTLDSLAPAPRLLGLLITSPVPAAQPLSIPANTTNPGSAPNHDLIAAVASTQSPASAIPSTDAGEHSTPSPGVFAAPTGTRSRTPAPTVRTNVALVATVPLLVANIATLDSKLVAQIADTSLERNTPSGLPATGSPHGQDGTKPQDAVPAPPNSQNLSSSQSARSNVPPDIKLPQPVANIMTVDSKLITQIADVTADRNAPSNLPSTGTPQGQNSVKPQDTAATLSNSQNLNSSSPVRTNVAPVTAVPQLIANIATLDSTLVRQIAYTAPNRAAPSNLPSTSTLRRPDSAKPQDVVPAPPGLQDLTSSSSVRTNVAPVTMLPLPVANIATLDAKLVIQVADTSPDRQTPSIFSSTSTLRRQDSAKSPDAAAALPGSQSLPSFPSLRTNLLPLARVPQPALPSAIPDVNFAASIMDAATNLEAPTILSSTDTPQVQGTADVTQTDPKSAAPSTSGVPTFQAFQRAHATFELLSLQTNEMPGNPSVEIPPSNPTSDTSQFIPKLQTSAATAALASATPVQASTKTMAIGASTPTLHEAPQSPAASVTQPGPAGVTAARSQSQHTSSGSQGNDASTKSDHATNSAVGRTDGKAFVQTLETAGVNTGNAHAESPDSTMVAAAMRTPIDPNAASVDTKPGTGSAAPLAQGQALPTPAGTDQTVVSSARLLDHPGQSEIRIEMQAGSLGGVELRAHISGNQVGASIAVEHHDAQVLLANDLPALHNALIEKNLRVDSLCVSQGTSSLMGGGHGSDAGQRGLHEAPPKALYMAEDESSVQVQDVPADSLGASRINARLSVLA